ncbi:MucR family transcriptional regulator [Mesorhizobium sp.]|uniref:MucR family transcriptional regulator n=1 Tax=Mesorhizobium sp. TaxID=1871066 RepID=UPI0009F20A55|nr:MucR family transcriptional regulator [Mesorhizobium sp.]RWC34699.1 MAG: MucR family transcriptional regulator [Mesorhizobium sp.]RWC45523.1 MAG: MucR family transcriptional regulator [Mesorhizobium sp.]RWD26237.1 MAG: MucR family transcriptional regulator [Mesorhizobium sp.]RWD74305.1 MAG: MucR family transcriptional regulator [Mesorhizobium sp.]RWE91037.1 MAG: MucR family transcriptional regulator [Mesorhizobium sp.]
MDEVGSKNPIVKLMADVVSAYVSNNPVPANELPSLIDQIYQSLALLRSDFSTQTAVEPLKPAVPIRKSVTPDFLISLESGKKFKSLKRHLRASYGLSPDEYRAKWNLPSDYPMVAPNYAVSRSLLAKKFGLGLKPQEAKKSAAKKQSRAKRS